MSILAPALLACALLCRTALAGDSCSASTHEQRVLTAFRKRYAVVLHDSAVALTWEGRWVMRATRSLHTGDRIVAVPVREAMTTALATATIRQWDPGGSVMAYIRSTGLRNFALSILLLLERRKGAASPYETYINILPPLDHDFAFLTDVPATDVDCLMGLRHLPCHVDTCCALSPSAACCCSRAHREHLLAEERHTMAAISMLGRLSGAFSPQDPPLREVRWALSVVRTRAFTLQPPHGSSLVPILDMFDHSTAHGVPVQFNSEAVGELRSALPVQAGTRCIITMG